MNLLDRPIAVSRTSDPNASLNVLDKEPTPSTHNPSAVMYGALSRVWVLRDLYPIRQLLVSLITIPPQPDDAACTTPIRRL